MWMTNKGHSTSGQEDLVLLRMRLHSQRGDTKALQREWENYQRSLILDDGHVLEASPKIIALLDESPRDPTLH